LSFDALEFRVGVLYSVSELKESLAISKFMPHYSMWSDGSDVYLFKHLPFRQLKIKYQLEKIIYKQCENDINNCFSRARLGL
jgi:hypothetical protein